MVVLGAYGRIASDIDFRTTNSGISVAEFRLAVDRRGKDRGTNFFKVVAFRETADNISKYFHKGSRICIEGELDKPDRYQGKDGNYIYPEVQIIARSFDFVDTRAESGNVSASAPAPQAASNPASAPDSGNDFMSVPDGIDSEELPFS